MKQLFLFILLLIVFYPVNSHANVEYARQTGKACSFCHIDPSGGGPLTKEGKAFRDDLRIKGLYRPLTTTQHIVRLIIGYLHTMTAIIWFGAILYVHLLLKPAYAARGLPKGELLVGWASMIIMAVTGTLLTISRVPSFRMLFHTRFGILLSIKIVLFLIMVTSAAIVTFVIGPKLKRKKMEAIRTHKQDLTMEELSQFDGKEDRPAYVAYNGKIYDVTGSRLWKDGSHMKKHLAGFDLTEAMKQAPHGEDKILGFPEVGRLIKSHGESKRPLHERVFYFFAYMNLVFVFLIIFVISLWRWW
ncbi:MAG: cytochrome B5 [Nitrospirae bacterium]|nr:MAG: cytochrome B5 [Nitrospirota bacterium]